MKCGEAVIVKDVHGSYSARFIAQCEGRFLLITHTGDYRNGYMLTDWHGVLRELVARTVPAKMIEHICHAESTGTGTYNYLPLTYPLPVKGLANLLGVPADEVREQLADLAVEVDGG